MFSFSFAAGRPDPTQITPILDLIGKYEIWEILVTVVVLNIPSILAWWSQRGSGKKMDALYNRYLADKDAEIQRLAARIKDLENVTLARKRP